jgi:Ca2+-binding EF-hand superfamily protein
MANRLKRKAGNSTMEEYLQERFGWEANAGIDYSDFMTKMMKILDLTKDEVKEAFEALDVA